MSMIDQLFRNPSKNMQNYWTGVAVYFVIALPALLLAQNQFADSPLRYVLVTLPVIPAFWAGYSLIQYILEQDELTRKTHMEATMLAAVALCAFTFTYGFLETVGLPPFPTLLIFPIFMVMWGIAYFFTKHKYGLPLKE